MRALAICYQQPTSADVGRNQIESAEDVALAVGLLGVGAHRVARLRIDQFFQKSIFNAGTSDIGSDERANVLSLAVFASQDRAIPSQAGLSMSGDCD